jgi:mono/diheme cytochrome c family protein
VKRLLILGIVVVAVVAAAAVMTRGMGLTTRRHPLPLEAPLARAARRWVTPASIRIQGNPVPASAEVIEAGMEHWADHCAACHANDGSANTSMGRGFYPPVPDMRAAPTQGMTDGELFYAIEHGVPFTGMPAWGTGTPDGERSSWELVRFIRHLPSLTAGEVEHMESLNPRSAADKVREDDIRNFLEGRQK